MHVFVEAIPGFSIILSVRWRNKGDSMMIHDFQKSTPKKTNIAPEKWWLEDYFPFGKAYFQGLC